MFSLLVSLIATISKVVVATTSSSSSSRRRRFLIEPGVTSGWVWKVSRERNNKSHMSLQEIIVTPPETIIQNQDQFAYHLIYQSILLFEQQNGNLPVTNNFE